jgi:hypothetical protein
MKVTITLLTALCVTLVAAEDEQFIVLGTIENVSPNTISIKTQRGSIQIGARSATEVIKDKTYRDFSALKIGDEISARCQPEASGRLVVTNIWAKPVNLTGTVKDVQGDDAIVATQESAETITVRLYPDTVVGTNRRDVVVGKHVRVTGVETGRNAVDAFRVAVYDTDVPVKKD